MSASPGNSGSIYSHLTESPPNEQDISLRPPDFTEFYGQEKVKERLMLMVAAAKQRGDVLHHVLLSGPPGLGKTTLAYIVAHAVGRNLYIASGPQIEKAKDLAGLLTRLEEGDILFIDEIHRLNPAVEEYLYPAMEDFRLDIMIDQGPAARSVNMRLKPFTLIGATTRSGMLTGPLRSRFGIANRLDYYNTEEICKILARSAALLGIEMSPEGAESIARRSRGTPRVANALLRWVRDFAQVRSDGRITGETAEAALGMIDIDADGLDEMVRSVSPRWPSRWGRMPPLWRTSMNPSSSCKAISSVPRADAKLCPQPMSNLASRRRAVKLNFLFNPGKISDAKSHSFLARFFLRPTLFAMHSTDDAPAGT